MVDNGLDGKQLTYQVLIYESLWLVHKSNRENILHTTRTVGSSMIVLVGMTNYILILLEPTIIHNHH